ncbi:polysaccharide pyruvyl transferase family protein [Tropicibacter sp. Alg240-R139]|uniref:polysaccharide pyruvyl transferase family protein n=1 Tax=Tropicibacter sp. Alg240-R139 TaxID=2305991 RepID=UPI0013DEAC36|nr:polysaccharide pyruvyl transferase family protein [Tropicibacter sp. Alg240-R139]
MITLLNAAPDTGNQGVSALCHAVVAGLAQRGATQMTVADHGRGLRQADWGYVNVNLVGLTHHRRYWRGDSLRTAHAIARVKGRFNAPARVVLGSRAVLDISGGDSFTDIYGTKRFQAMALTKRLALDAGVPLILLPQKLGPFRDDATLDEAVSILRRAKAVWVRDAQSFEFLQMALGASFDADRHRLGVDVAVALPAAEPAHLPLQVSNWLAPDRGVPVAGLNVSGLLCNEDDTARQAFGLKTSHRDQLDALAQALLRADPNLRLLLVPHVQRPDGDPESDLDAARALRARLGERERNRVQVLEERLSAMELKWVLSRLDWFAGARMHATIGAFSSGVPTLGLGYTDKAHGVFAQCGIGDEVVDLRRADARHLAGRAVASFTQRSAMNTILQHRLTGVKSRAADEMDVIAQQAGVAA